MKQILIFLLGAILGAALLLFVVLMQWHAPGKFGGYISWLPMPPEETIDTAGSIRAIPPVAAHVSDVEPGYTDVIMAEPVPMMSPPVVPEAAAVAEPQSELQIPVAGIKPGQLYDTFNDARGTARVHDAIDIMAPKGTAVLAAADGKIVKLFNSKQGGLTIYQFNPEETHAYYYAHLDSYLPALKEGSIVKRGDVIAYVGSTGNASPDAPHLHFAIFVLGPEKKWWMGTAMNPYPLLGGTRK